MTHIQPEQPDYFQPQVAPLEAQSNGGEYPVSARAWGLSWIRTFVPILWGYVITFVATLSPDVAGLLSNEAVYAAVVGAVTSIWYGVFRKLEPHLPAWLTRFVLGANSRPVYTVDRAA